MEDIRRNDVCPPLSRRLTVHFHRSKPLLLWRRAKLLLFAALSIAVTDCSSGHLLIVRAPETSNGPLLSS